MARGKEILSSFNPLLAFTLSQDHPQKGLSTKMESKRMVGISLEHCHLWGDRKRRERVGKESGPWVGAYNDDILKSNTQ